MFCKAKLLSLVMVLFFVPTKPMSSLIKFCTNPTVIKVAVTASASVYTLGKWCNYLWDKQKTADDLLWQSIECNNDTLLEEALKKGANPNQVTTDGRTPLMVACYNAQSAQEKIMHLLLAHKANPNLGYILPAINSKCYTGSTNNEKFGAVRGDTALIIAARNGNSSAVNLLLAGQADHSLKNTAKENAYDVAWHFYKVCGDKKYQEVMKVIDQCIDQGHNEKKKLLENISVPKDASEIVASYIS